jgi:hypothetical protein
MRVAKVTQSVITNASSRDSTKTAIEGLDTGLQPSMVEALLETPQFAPNGDDWSRLSARRIPSSQLGDMVVGEFREHAEIAN